jgi:isoquinoline 1-oxidoreductase beta subunit
VFGAKLRSFDAAHAKAVAGVVDVVAIPTGVAVLARDTWSALKGREALRLAWDDSAAEKRSSDAILAEYKQIARRPGLVALNRGDAARAIAGAAKVLEAEFEFPYLAHAPMEPMNGTIARNPDGTVEAWAGFQFQTIEQATVAAILESPRPGEASHALGRRLLWTARHHDRGLDRGRRPRS